jgi:membrane protein
MCYEIFNWAGELVRRNGFAISICGRGRQYIMVRRVILMEAVKSLLKSVDSFQQSHPMLAFPVAVIKRYGDDKAGRQAALVTYYAFLSVFPLLLIFITVLGILVANNSTLETQIMQNVFQLFPSLGDDLRKNVQSLHTSGLALALQGLIVLYGARGLASILQETFNNLWHIEPHHRPGFLGDNARSFAMMLSVGLGMVIGVAISVGLNSVVHIGWLGTVFITMVNLGITFGLFLIVFRLGTSERIALGKLVLGAIIATIGIVIIQRMGGFIMKQQLPKLQGSYGSFAITLGMLFWIYLQAQVILYAIVATIVRAEKDWPKKLF